MTFPVPVNPGDDQQTLLIVDDNQASIRLLREAFRDRSTALDIVAVQDGTDALNYLYRKGQFANARRPSLILLDLNLPRKNGQEVIAEIKTDPQLKTIPVVVLSNSRRQKDIDASYKLHANCYIQKPSSLKQLLTVARRIDEFWLNTVALPTVGCSSFEGES
ncbi:MAG: response regulator [Cyanobacteria bacterium P01_F01_bin.153]